MSNAEQERREQTAKQRAVDLGLKMTRSGDVYVLLTETDAPLATGPLSEIEARLGTLEKEPPDAPDRYRSI
jgi:hypothetical protein